MSRNGISFVIVANSNWGDYATPYIESVLRHEPDTEIVLVDNGSIKPYEEYDNYKLIRLEVSGHYNYMRALNEGAKLTNGEWLIFSNDDILCWGGFRNEILDLPHRGLYGREMRTKDPAWGLGRKLKYIYGWIMLMHSSVWDEVGKFDEYYLHAGFDDIDYSWRCQCKKIPLKTIHLPFVHLADTNEGYHRRMEVDGYKENMLRSKEHFLEKVKNDLC